MHLEKDVKSGRMEVEVGREVGAGRVDIEIKSCTLWENINGDMQRVRLRE